MNEVTLKIWFVGTVLLAVKMWFNSAVQAHARFRHKTFAIPEDAEAFGALTKTEVTLAASAGVRLKQ